MLEPVTGTPTAVAECGTESVLVVADYHAGLEVVLREDGVELASRADDRREALLDVLGDVTVDRVLLLGDVVSSIGPPVHAERRELESLLEAVTDRVPVTITKGNHDGAIESVTDDFAAVTVVEGAGTRIGSVGFCHGHTWPTEAVVAAETVCSAHEHPAVRLVDEVGGARTERVWLRGRLDPGGFPDYDPPAGALVVCPAFNGLVGGTWVNQDDEFLSPFLPEGLADGEAYLLDGTRLGDYRHV